MAQKPQTSIILSAGARKLVEDQMSKRGEDWSNYLSNGAPAVADQAEVDKAAADAARFVRYDKSDRSIKMREDIGSDLPAGVGLPDVAPPAGYTAAEQNRPGISIRRSLEDALAASARSDYQSALDMFMTGDQRRQAGEAIKAQEAEWNRIGVAEFQKATRGLQARAQEREYHQAVMAEADQRELDLQASRGISEQRPSEPGFRAAQSAKDYGVDILAGDIPRYKVRFTKNESYGASNPWDFDETSAAVANMFRGVGRAVPDVGIAALQAASLGRWILGIPDRGGDRNVGRLRAWRDQNLGYKDAYGRPTSDLGLTLGGELADVATQTWMLGGAPLGKVRVRVPGLSGFKQLGAGPASPRALGPGPASTIPIGSPATGAGSTTKLPPYTSRIADYLVKGKSGRLVFADLEAPSGP